MMATRVWYLTSSLQLGETIRGEDIKDIWHQGEDSDQDEATLRSRGHEEARSQDSLVKEPGDRHTSHNRKHSHSASAQSAGPKWYPSMVRPIRSIRNTAKCI